MVSLVAADDIMSNHLVYGKTYGNKHGDLSSTISPRENTFNTLNLVKVKITTPVLLLDPSLSQNNLTISFNKTIVKKA